MFPVFVLLLLLAPMAAGRAAESAQSQYQELLAVAKSGDGQVDWQKLRFAYSESPDFDLLGTKTQAARNAMTQDMAAKNYAGALDQADLILDQTFVDIDAHLVSAIANAQLGHSDEAQKQRAIVIGLVKSIRTGDGKTPATAFTVICVGEEYSLIGIMGLRRTQQALINRDGHSYDVLNVVDHDGKEQSLYFQIDRVVAAEATLVKGMGAHGSKE
jgi:hypothetical protein